MNPVRLVPIVFVTLALSAVGQAQWTRFSYDYHVAAQNIRSVGGPMLFEESGDYEWETSVPNWYLVTRDSTQDPPWDMMFANLCTNEWYYSESFSAHINAGHSVYQYENYEARWGHETFIRDNPSESARRDIGTLEAPGYHVTNDLYFNIVGGGGGSG